MASAFGDAFDLVLRQAQDEVKPQISRALMVSLSNHEGVPRPPASLQESVPGETP